MNVHPEIKKIQLLLDILEQRVSLGMGSLIASPLSLAQLQTIHSKLASQSSEVLQTLDELDKASLRVPSLLRYFVEDFIRLSREAPGEIKTLAYSLQGRFMQYSPG